ncbi:MAG: rhomboid family intramembrane serine protease [Rhodothermales bacterium]
MISLDAAPITLMLLVVNVLVSIYGLFMDQSLIARLSFRPVLIQRGQAYRFITGAFVHAGIGHLAFNMITLYFFGPWMEVRVGSLPFLLLYFGSLLAAHAYTYVKKKDDPSYAAVGASGAVSGVLLGFCLYQPFAMLGIMFVIPMPAILFAVLYIGGSIYMAKQAEAQGAQGGIAHEAHLGGALGGILITIALDPSVIGAFFRQITSVIG